MNLKNGNLKTKIVEILITAVLSALIAGLQSVLFSYTNNHISVNNIEIAGGIGATIRGATLYVRSYL